MQTVVLADGYEAILPQYGPKYNSFVKYGAHRSELVLYSPEPMDIYITKGNTTNPTKFDYDMSVMKTNWVALDSYSFDTLAHPEGYSVVVFTQSYDEPNNTASYNNVTVAFRRYNTTTDSELPVEVASKGIFDVMNEHVNSLLDFTHSTVNSSHQSIRTSFSQIFNFFL